MELKKKILIFISITGVVLLLFFFLLYRLIIYQSEREQKYLFAQKVISRVEMVIENEQKRLDTLCFDWASWDAMYDYIASPTKGMQYTTLAPQTLRDIDVNLLLILDSQQNVLHSIFYSNNRKHFDNQSELASRNGPLWGELKRTFRSVQTEKFIVNTANGPLILVSFPVIRKNDRGFIRGRLVMGRLIDSSFESKISSAIREKTEIIVPASQTVLTSDFMRRMREWPVLFDENETSFSIYHLFRDIAGRDSFIARIDIDKKLFGVLEDAFRIFFIALLLILLLFTLLIYLFVHYQILRRIRDIAQKTRMVVSLEDLSHRIAIEYKDEISLLSSSINKMFERLHAENQRQKEFEKLMLLNEKLIAAGRVAANVAHEINNPLFAISNSIQVIKKSFDGSHPDAAEAIELAEHEITRVRKITRDINDYSHMNADIFEKSDLVSILLMALQVLKWSKQVAGFEVVFTQGGQEFPVVCYADGVQQVFMNLILNACEATEGRGRLEIRIERSESWYEIHFTDNGPGFLDSIKEHIFEPFNSSKDVKNVGLGLYISYSIVKKHGGEIQLLDGDGGGAHMVIRLPEQPFRGDKTA